MVTNAKPVVIKVGGNDLAKPGFIEQLAEIITKRQTAQPQLIVHGGGRVIDDLMRQLNIQPQYIDGQRITDEATLDVAEMVLSGQINKRLVLALLQVGVDAIGVSGVDQGLLHVEPWAEHMGLVGRIVNVRANILLEWCSQQVIPVISPISIGQAGRYNVNADHAAGAVAEAVGAATLVFLTNVPGVTQNNEVIPELTRKDVTNLIEQEIITGGMIPKVNSAFQALDQGVQQVMITNLQGLHTHTGTIFIR